ncbi:uncharacterized protein ARMOST_02702 [Armillaria ostoyae]|uniref:Ricin B lectin domain-containing protein n=1 Tax=Armillaria ostoyae TaxID=47428 RepID=A0A284QSF3_ARMOS|nr:uncharacterized protein ARMOST_02702 [Armillaria ostoyae]
MTLSRGIYIIDNAGAPLSMDIDCVGSSADGTKILGWHDDNFNWNHLWLVEPVDGKTDTFTVRSLIAGTYMTLAGGAEARACMPRTRSGSSSALWTKTKKATSASLCLMKNYASGTFADLYHGGSSNGTPIYGCKGPGFKTHDKDSWHQCWTFKHRSLSSAEIKKIIMGNKFHLSLSKLTVNKSYKSFQVDGEYLILPQNLWEEIWLNSTDLSGKKRRREIFDYDDFALTMKTTVAQWGAKTCDHADGFSIFCGLMLGRSLKSPREGRTYNFTISDDHSRVVFFDPQDNKFIMESDKIDCDASHFYV